MQELVCVQVRTPERHADQRARSLGSFQPQHPSSEHKCLCDESVFSPVNESASEIEVCTELSIDTIDARLYSMPQYLVGSILSGPARQVTRVTGAFR
jgi:hypothetical protein